VDVETIVRLKECRYGETDGARAEDVHPNRGGRRTGGRDI
jgi:hypothetical protein